jgi:hypothetical protein
MDIELVNVINLIKSYKHDLYLVHKPELVDGRTTLIEHLQSPPPVSYNDKAIDRAYTKLMTDQRRTLHKKPDDKIKVIIESGSETSQHQETQQQPQPQPHPPNDFIKNEIFKPWIKISYNIKVQLVSQYIDALVPKLSDTERGRLLYVLISSIAQKMLSKPTDVEYDTVKGRIVSIKNLFYDSQTHDFKLSENVTDKSFPFTVAYAEPVQPKRKLVLKNLKS